MQSAEAFAMPIQIRTLALKYDQPRVSLYRKAMMLLGKHVLISSCQHIAPPLIKRLASVLGPDKNVDITQDIACIPQAQRAGRIKLCLLPPRVQGRKAEAYHDQGACYSHNDLPAETSHSLTFISL